MPQDSLKSFSLEGKNALVTGGAGLLGVEHCAALMATGCHVVLTDVIDDKLDIAKNALDELGTIGTCQVELMDVTSKVSIDSVADNLYSQGCRIDILVNNAAIDPKIVIGEMRDMSRLENMKMEDWDFQVAVGLTGAFLCTQTFGSRMAVDGHGGVILNIASDLSVIAPDQRLYSNNSCDVDNQPVKPVTYSVIKSGLIGLTRYVATYWADRGVRANALSPGGVYTSQNDEFVRRLTGLIPLGRMANHDEYRAAVQFLCSDASSYMNGQNIVIDGGRSVW